MFLRGRLLLNPLGSTTPHYKARLINGTPVVDQALISSAAVGALMIHFVPTHYHQATELVLALVPELVPYWPVLPKFVRLSNEAWVGRPLCGPVAW